MADPTRILYTVAEAAKLLSVSPDFIYRRINAGEMHAVDLGGERKNQRITRAELDRYIDARIALATMPPALSPHAGRRSRPPAGSRIEATR